MADIRTFLFVSIFLFALLLAVLAGLAFFAIRMSSKERSGERSALGGCALAGALGCLGTCAVVAFVALLALLAGRAIVHDVFEANPLRSVTVHRADEAAATPSSEPERPLHLIFEVAGSEFDWSPLLALVREVSEGDASVSSESTTWGDGTVVTKIDIALPADGNDLDAIERALRARWPSLDFGNGVALEFKHTARDL